MIGLRGIHGRIGSTGLQALDFKVQQVLKALRAKRQTHPVFPPRLYPWSSPVARRRHIKSGLQQGDIVVDGSPTGASTVITFLHRDLMHTASFLALSIAGLPAALKVTPEHFQRSSRASAASQPIACRTC